jgi:solute carrier family 25 (mitochondrial carnitine/acylcarnitine transporter), member 20/29
MQSIVGDESFSKLFVSGAVAGVVGSMVNGPMEHIRIRVQSVNSKYRGSKDALIKIYNKHGVKGVFKGHMTSMARESFMGFYLGCYTYTVKNTLDEYGNKKWYSTILGSIFGGYYYKQLSLKVFTFN